MNNKQLDQIDILGSRYDGLTSIGALPTNENQVEIFSPLPVADTGGPGLTILGASFSAALSSEEAQTAMKAASEISKATGASNQGGRNAANDIRSFTRSPITHAAIAAVATAVPVGTVAAGVAEVGLGIAEGVAFVAENFGGAIEGLFGGGKPKPILTEKETKKRGVRLATNMLAARVDPSKKGRAKAMKKVSAQLAEMSVDLKTAAAFTKGLSNGLSEHESKELAKFVGATGKLDSANIAAVARKVYPKLLKEWQQKNRNKPVPPPPQFKRVNDALKEGAKNLVERAKEATAKRGTTSIDGVFVSRSGGKHAGRFVNESLTKTGGIGCVVLKSGRVVFGSFKAV